MVVAGRHDPIFPISGVEKAFNTIREVYRAAGAPEACELVVGEGEHRFFADLAWPVFNEMASLK